MMARACSPARSFRRRVPARPTRRRASRSCRRCSEGRGRSRRRWRPAREIGHVALKRLHRHVVAHQEPVEAQCPPDDFGYHARRERRGPFRIERLETDMAVMPAGRSASSAKGRKSCDSSSARLARTVGSSRWLSVSARPWPGMCFITGSTPPAARPVAAARPSVATISGRSP